MTISFTRLCAVSRDTVYLGTMPEDQELGTPFSAVCQYHHGEWSYETFDFPLASMALYQAPDSPHRILYLLSETGVAVNFHTKEREILLPAKSPVRNGHRLGHLRKIEQVAGQLFACGRWCTSVSQGRRRDLELVGSGISRWARRHKG